MALAQLDRITSSVGRVGFRFRAKIALTLSLLTVVAGIQYGAFVAGGADSYGYLAEARLWREGRLTISQPFVVDLPWVEGAESSTPLGFRPSSEGAAIVPVHAPGYPLLLALVQSLAGYWAGFLIVPLSGGLLVGMTYVIGARLGRPMVGLAAALLVASSPTTLFMLVNPMSDLPAAAAWSVTLACLLSTSRRSAWLAGVTAAVAILIRPNLVPLAGVLALFAPRKGPYVAGTAAGILIQMMINAHLYGSPFVSGYGNLQFAASHLSGNVQRYFRWLVETDTLAAFAGLVSVVVPAHIIWTTPAARQARWLFLAVVMTIWLPALLYMEFEAWWYLRYVLATWPIMALGTASVVAVLYRTARPALKVASVALLLIVALHGLVEAKQRFVFEVAHTEQRYVDAAHMVTLVTDETSVIVTVQHSGSVRYYAGRMTFRWDVLLPGELDRAIAWLHEHGHKPFLLLENTEFEPFRSRFGATDVVGRLDWEPVAALDATTHVFLFDATGFQRRGHIPPAAHQRASTRRPLFQCPRPVEMAAFSRK